MTISTHRPLPIFSRPKILSPKSHQQRSLSALSSSSHQISLKIPTIISVPSSRSPRTKKKSLFRAAYVSAPASDPDSIEKSASADEARESSVGSSAKAVSWAVLWPLLARHKPRIAVSMVSLVGGTSCVLSMPIFSGNFFEVLIGRRTEPLWTLLSKIAVIYILEPIFTVVYVINMTTIWERVMASLRGQIFRRMLIQKVEFFDTYKVGELTGLLTSDLGSLKDVVSENISRDHGLRALSEEPVLFSVSVGENIAYGLPDEDVSKEEIIKAAKAANAHEFIISLPQGYDTLVGERGSLLSGGQRQRIAIARAILKNAPTLILDEATSALDAVSERLVQEALDHLMKDRTSLVIAHRLSTVQNAHQIAVCSDGKIAELGTHSELLARKGQYASLVGTQRLAFE